MLSAVNFLSSFPSFMIMSFYFMQKTLILLNFKLFGQRIIRLMIPYLSWPIIIFALNNLILAKILKLNHYGEILI